ncbi:MAG: cytochrome c peroxidase [Bacteroidota bacterium]
MGLKIKCAGIVLLIALAVVTISFKQSGKDTYGKHYLAELDELSVSQSALLESVRNSPMQSASDIVKIKNEILNVRQHLKGMDFWLRYLEPTVYKKMNGPLPVEWETEVFEKFEKPYKREGAGLTLALQALDEPQPNKAALISLIQQSITAEQTYKNDSITKHLTTFHHFYLCNRLYLLNLAAIYTTGFECPDTAAIVHELRRMTKDVKEIYLSYNESFPTTALSTEYLKQYDEMIDFIDAQSSDFSSFDHFTFIRNYVNPLFIKNQKMVKEFGAVSKNMLDYSLNKEATSIFKKDLYFGQNPKGIFLRVDDAEALSEIEELGRLLFYDPILSGNNQRSCASCHKPGQYFADTTLTTAFQFNGKDNLTRNTPSLVNAEFNHLIMLDGLHFTLQHQIKAVVANPIEMGTSEKDALIKILSCKDYEKGFKKLLKYTPQEQTITFDHIASAISFYYSRFSNTYAPFDNAMNDTLKLDPAVIKGFNIFMSKAQCATCHFVPQFNGVKPPYIGSEFEVLGVPADTGFRALSKDKGRYEVNPAVETMSAFRTGSIRNAQYTKPYMHNGVFSSLMEVINFYNNGGGAGRSLAVPNQTLSADKLGLSETEKQQLILFIFNLTEPIPKSNPPARLPVSRNKALNTRIVGGIY